MKNFYCIHLFPTNCFLLKAKRGYLLIDTGVSKKFKLFKKAIKKFNINLNEIRYIFLTHYHYDHAGFVAQLRDETGAKIIVHRESIPFLEKGSSISPFIRGDGSSLNGCVKAINLIYSKFISHSFIYPPVRIKESDIIIEGDDKDILRDIGINGKILYTPGHTFDSISILLSDGKAFIGDAAMNFLNICWTNYRPILAESYKEVFKSWQKLIREGAKIFYPSHGAPFSSEKLIKKYKNFIYYL